MPQVAPRAIETVYRGYRFRSRLEARWAVFYDHLGVVWEYEKEGYDLGDVGWYLPDFWLPAQRVWIEIKPEAPTEIETERGYRLADATGHSLIIFFGQIPMPVSKWELDAGGIDGAHICYADAWDNFRQWCECPACGMVGIEFDGRADRLDCRLTDCPGDGQRADRGHNVGSPRLVAAYTAARQARFGRSGRG